MLNVKIQNKNKNLQMSNYLSGFCGVPCENSTGDSGLNSYIYEPLQYVHLVVQGDVGLDTDASSAADATTEQNVGFNDAKNNVISEIPHPMNYLNVDSSQNIELGNFLKRPVKIYGKSWSIGNTVDAASDNFSPWHAFFNKTSIKKKLDNYYMVRCNLHLKFVVNASPFFYGCVLASYQPLTDFNPAPVVISAADRLENMPFSQRPHIYLYPQNSQGGEMVLPFLYYKNWLNATSASDLTNMGKIYLNSFDALKNANGVVADTINFHVYAWAEDVEVAGPTVTLAVQGKDEYSHGGMVSRPASAIARAAGKLSKLPIIGEFATATSYAAGAVADIASLFGYTDVPVIDDVHAFQPKAFPNIAATDIGVPIEKLTLDSKNELSIDPKIAGANVEDELIVSSFVQRESYLFNSTWSATDATNIGLFYCRVGPSLVRSEAITNATVVYSTPMAHVSRCFKYWRGDIIFRFKFICSKYHRGRVQINWTPTGDIGTIGDYTTETYTRVIDITEENDVEFVVPYTQLTSYLECELTNSTQCNSASTSVAGVNTYYNGIITMRVLNQQSSPVTSADINILTFVRGSDNLEFAGPRDIPSTYSPYVVQGDCTYDDENSRYQLGVGPSIADKNINLVYMGEAVHSLRTLMRRKSRYLRLVRDQVLTLDTRCCFYSILGRHPIYPGYDQTGLNVAVGLTSAVAEDYNYVPWSYVTWFSMCFVGNRGSYNYIVHPYTPTDVLALEVTRSDKAHSNTTDNLVRQHSAVTGTKDYQREFANTDAYGVGMSGSSLISQKNLAGTIISAPMYSRFKFHTNSVTARTVGSATDGTNTDSIMTMATVDFIGGASTDLQFTQDMYVSAGTDFSLIFFLNVPVLYAYGSYPATA